MAQTTDTPLMKESLSRKLYSEEFSIDDAIKTLDDSTSLYKSGLGAELILGAKSSIVGDYKGKGFRVISISVDDSTMEVVASIKALKRQKDTIHLDRVPLDDIEFEETIDRLVKELVKDATVLMQLEKMKRGGNDLLVSDTDMSINLDGLIQESKGTEFEGIALTPLVRKSMTGVVDFSINKGAIKSKLLKSMSADKRKELAEDGVAMEDGSFPVRNKSDLQRAIRLLGNQGRPVDARDHVISRAREIGLSKLIPSQWYRNDIVEKSFSVLMKAKDYSKLVKKQIVDKHGKKKTVYVQPYKKIKHNFPSDDHAYAAQLYMKDKKFMSKENALNRIDRMFGKGIGDYIRNEVKSGSDAAAKKLHEQSREITARDIVNVVNTFPLISKATGRDKGSIADGMADYLDSISEHISADIYEEMLGDNEFMERMESLFRHLAATTYDLDVNQEFRGLTNMFDRHGHTKASLRMKDTAEHKYTDLSNVTDTQAHVIMSYTTSLYIPMNKRLAGGDLGSPFMNKMADIAYEIFEKGVGNIENNPDVDITIMTRTDGFMTDSKLKEMGIDKGSTYNIKTVTSVQVASLGLHFFTQEVGGESNWIITDTKNRLGAKIIDDLSVQRPYNSEREAVILPTKNMKCVGVIRSDDEWTDKKFDNPIHNLYYFKV